jgi:hypothetical protein
VGRTEVQVAAIILVVGIVVTEPVAVSLLLVFRTVLVEQACKRDDQVLHLFVYVANLRGDKIQRVQACARMCMHVNAHAITNHNGSHGALDLTLFAQGMGASVWSRQEASACQNSPQISRCTHGHTKQHAFTHGTIHKHSQARICTKTRKQAG